MEKKYDIIVVGGGHAGCEAALASARLNNKTLLITSNINNIADMPCNPSIGGPAKGIIVREISALGGEMSNIIDQSFLQLKMLNTKKGPAVRSLRAQADKIIYQKKMKEALDQQKNLKILEGMVESLIISDDMISGIRLETGEAIISQSVILTTGTYLKANILVGSSKISSGPHEEKPCQKLSTNLKDLGFNIKRLKTGTPPRIAKESIDYDQAILQEGDNCCWNFSVYKKNTYDPKKQLPCYLLYTNNDTHQIIRQNLEQSSMYGGFVEGIGPRYCPSIEDKIVRFSDKERHQLFLEPESIYYDDIYLQGFSTSMPHEIQEKMIHSLKGLEKAKINKYAYAIEYDAIDSIQLKASLETKIIENLYTAGQINGTSGYEEAACQGLIAGINASRKLKGEKPLILKRNEAYIGVLIDDLVTKGVIDPYRLLTSRAEYRLLLRHDNADLRLGEYGYNIGLVSKKNYQKLQDKKQKIALIIDKLKHTKLPATKEINDELQKLSSAKLYDGICLYDLLKRPEIKIENILKWIDENFDDEILEQAEIQAKYEGYIAKATKEAEKMEQMDNMIIPDDLDYNEFKNIAKEAREKLQQIHPHSIGQAIRISGVNPADITMLMMYLKRRKNEY